MSERLGLGGVIINPFSLCSSSEYSVVGRGCGLLLFGWNKIKEVR